jgi:hypothetical protein
VKSRRGGTVLSDSRRQVGLVSCEDANRIVMRKSGEIAPEGVVIEGENDWSGIAVDTARCIIDRQTIGL